MDSNPFEIAMFLQSNAGKIACPMKKEHHYIIQGKTVEKEIISEKKPDNPIPEKGKKKIFGNHVLINNPNNKKQVDRVEKTEDKKQNQKGCQVCLKNGKVKAAATHSTQNHDESYSQRKNEEFQKNKKQKLEDSQKKMIEGSCMDVEQIKHSAGFESSGEKNSKGTLDLFINSETEIERDKEEVREEICVPGKGPKIILDVNLGGEMDQIKLMIDTGSSTSLVTRNIIKKYNLLTFRTQIPITFRGLFGQTEAIREIAVLNLEFGEENPAVPAYVVEELPEQYRYAYWNGPNWYVFWVNGAFK